ncbi:MAG: hypothetical protein ACYDHH_10785 [Solirubrobacteraceae bacterium]
MPWKLTVRTGGKVVRSRYAELSEALDAAEEAARVAASNAPRKVVDAKIRRFEPVQQVIARVELAGPERVLPKIRAGLDVRGDGSAEAYLGRVKRELVEERKRETPYQALRRVLVALQNEG